ncbi:MAG: glycosyltransferase family 9 protein [Planctomycetes bacterium]|nr:glycosyltransferase family 9 protein [Planctomycetota bacterium]
MTDWSTISSVCAIMPTWIGDICMATPALRLLRERLPEAATLTAATRPGMSPLLRGLPWIDDIIEINPQGLLGPWRAGAAIAATKPEAVLVLPGSWRSALTSRLSGASRRIGYARDARGWMLSDATKPPDRSHPVSTVGWYAGLVDADAAVGLPELSATEVDRADAAEVLPPHFKHYAVLVPGANREDKRWPADRFAAIANVLHTARGWPSVISGGPSEQSLCAEVASECNGPVIDLAAAGSSLAALKAIVDGAELMVTNDTGPRHIAIGLGTPVVSLFGPTDHRWTLMSEANECRLLAEPFLPEDLVADRCGNACAIDRIAIEDVVQATWLVCPPTTAC